MTGDSKHITIEEARKKYMSRQYEVHDETSEEDMLHPGHVFDENMSVKWNNEQVKRHNERISAKIKENKKIQQQLNELVHTDAINALMNDYGISFEAAKITEQLAYDEKHYCMADYYCFLDTLGNFAKMVIDAK